jgi:hypothetical protein
MKRRVRLTTVPKTRPPRRHPVPRPKGTPRPARASTAHVARIIDDDDKSLVDVIDSLLNQGVMLNADVILALANVDLVYLRLSALLCAADRILPPPR